MLPGVHLRTSVDQRRLGQRVLLGEALGKGYQPLFAGMAHFRTLICLPSPICGFVFSGNTGLHALHLDPDEVRGSLRHGDDLPPACVILPGIFSLSNPVMGAAVLM